MKKRNGYTLVELLGAIAVIMLLAGLVTPKVKEIVNENRNKSYHEIERRLEEAAAKYVVNEYIATSTDNIRIELEELIELGYVEKVYDLNDNSECDAYVEVSNLMGVAEFKAYLDCSSYKTE